MPRLKTLVLAAGKSTRIASVSGGDPKPLIRISGEAILHRNLRWLWSEGVRDVWINLHFRPDEIRVSVGDGSRFGLSVQYVYEPEILGTAGAVRNLAAEWHDTFLVVYGDSLLRLDLASFVEFHRMHKAEISVALFDRLSQPYTGIAGGCVELGSDDRIEAFREGAYGSEFRLVNAGVYLLEPAVVDVIPPCQFYDFGRDVFPQWLRMGRALYGYRMTGYCLGLDTPESYQQAVGLIQSGEVELL